MSAPSAPAASAVATSAIDVRPMRSLGLLSIAHAVNHAQAVMLPLIFLAIIDEYGVSVGAVAILAAVGAFASGMAQLSYAGLTRVVSRRRLLGIGGIIFGGGFALQAFAVSYLTFAIPNIASRIGGSPQHPVGNGLLSEQFPPERRGFAISAHIAGGNVGTVVVALIGVPVLAAVGWRGASIAFGLPAIAIAIAILILIRERGTDRAAARASGTVRSAFRRILGNHDLRWLYLTAMLGGGGRGLGVVNLFVLLYLKEVLGLDPATYGLMYGVLIVFSVPMPIVVGWLSDRVGRKPLIVGVYLGGAIGFVVFLRGGGVARLAVGRDHPDGPLQLRREPAAPGAARRSRATVDPRRVVCALLHDGLRGRVALGRRVRRDHRAGRRGCGSADRLRPDGADVPARGPRDAADPHRGRPEAARGRRAPLRSSAALARSSSADRAAYGAATNQLPPTPWPLVSPAAESPA